MLNVLTNGLAYLMAQFSLFDAPKTKLDEAKNKKRVRLNISHFRHHKTQL
jgi:hypothetical protein